MFLIVLILLGCTNEIPAEFNVEVALLEKQRKEQLLELNEFTLKVLEKDFYDSDMSERRELLAETEKRLFDMLLVNAKIQGILSVVDQKCSLETESRLKNLVKFDFQYGHLVEIPADQVKELEKHFWAQEKKTQDILMGVFFEVEKCDLVQIVNNSER